MLRVQGNRFVTALQRWVSQGLNPSCNCRAGTYFRGRDEGTHAPQAALSGHPLTGRIFAGGEREHDTVVPIYRSLDKARGRMKLTTIALATAFALYSTVALAAGAGGGAAAGAAGSAGTVTGGSVGLRDETTGNAGPRMPSNAAGTKHRTRRRAPHTSHKEAN
jgi:hypothetical protein